MDYDKKILDATAGSRMMWFDKQNPHAVYIDRRTETHTLCDGRVLEIAPDIEADFTELPFPDKSFKLVVFDPPHLERLGQNSWMHKKYGVLSLNWREMLRLGFLECMRVLDEHGVLIFKWNEAQVKLTEVMPLFPCPPLFGHTTGKHGRTIWVTFMKQ